MTYNSYKIIPHNLVEAIHSFDKLRSLHNEYYIKYAGPEGICSREKAFHFMVEDLTYYSLPVRYKNYNSFCAVLYRKPR